MFRAAAGDRLELRPGEPARPLAAGAPRRHSVHITIAPDRPRGARAHSGPAVEVVDLHRRYGGFDAVQGISFEVRPGEVFALLGVNGAGKTSALEVIEGLAPAGCGSVRVLG